MHVSLFPPDIRLPGALKPLKHPENRHMCVIRFCLMLNVYRGGRNSQSLAIHGKTRFLGS